MQPSNKSRLAELAELIRLSTAAEARMVIDMLGLMVEEARLRMVDADGNDIYRLQGETRGLTRLYKSLTVAPPNKESR